MSADPANGLHSSCRVFRCAAVAACLLFAVGTAWAQTAVTWSTTADGNWTTGSNWGGTAPANSLTTNYAYFNNVGSGGNTTVTVDNTRSIAGIRFGTSAGAFTISKTSSTVRTLTLGAYGILQEDDTDQIITGSSLRLTLGAASTFTVSGSGGLTISTTGGTLATTATNTLTLAGNGTGVGTISSQIAGAGLLTKSGSGTWTLSSSSNNYTGGTTIAGGTLIANANNALGTSGTIKFTGGTLQYGTGITTDYSARIATSSSAIAVNTNGNNVTFASALASTNTGGLTKSGSGTLTLSGNNAYTGTTTLAAGTLAANHASALGTSGNITFTGGTLQYGSGITTDWSSRIVNSTGAIAVDTNGNNVTFASSLASTNTGGLTKSGSGTLTLSAANSYTGVTTLAGGTLAMNHANALNTYGDITFTGGTLQYGTGITSDWSWRIVNSTGAIAIDTNGNDVTYWSTLGATNTGGLTKSGSGSLALGGSNAYTGTTTFAGGALIANNASAFGSSGNLTFTGGTLRYGSVTTDWSARLANSSSAMAIDTNGNDVAFASNIALTNTGGLTKSGSGTLTLSGNNAYTGTTTLAAGTLLANHASALGTSGNLTFTGGTLQYGTGITTDWSSRLASSSGAMAIDTNGNNVTFASNIASSNTGGLTKSGGGALTLSGANAYTGTTTLAAGTLLANHASALGTSGSLTFTGGTLQYGTGITTDWSSRLANSSSTMAIDTNGNNVTFASNIASSNTGGLTKSGSGTLTLSGANAYTGGTTLSAGGLAIGNNSALGSGTLTIDGGTLSASGGARTLSNAVTLGGDFTVDGSQDLTLGAVNLGAGTRTVTVSNSGTTTFGALGENSSANLVKDGTGRLVLSGASSFSGTTTVSGGTLALTNSGALGGSTWSNVIANNATLELSNNITVTEGGFTLTGSGYSSAGAINNLSGTNTLSAQLALGGATTINSTAGSLTLTGYTDLAGYGLTVTGAGDTTFSNQIGGSASALTKSGNGTLTLSGANSYSGGTSFGAGTLVANNASALGTSGNLTFTGGTLQYGTGITTDWSSRIANSSSAIKVDTNGNNVTFASSLASTNTGGLTKSGSGTLTFTGANSYTGATSVTGGTLQLQNSGGLGTGAVSVSGGSTLQLSYSGTNSNSNALTLNSGTLLNTSGTNSWLGTITLTGNGTLTNNSASEFAVENSSRALNVNLGSNTLTIDGTGNTRVYSRVGVSGDTGSLVKNGSGTLTFYGYENLYTGSTTVNEGTLVLDTANSYNDKTILGSLIIGDGTHSATVLYGTGSADNKIKDTSAVTINAGGLLDLNGRRDTIGALTMNGGTIDTRNVSGQQGILTLAGDVTIGGTSASTINGYQFSLNDQTSAGNVRNFTVADATGSTASDLTINSQVVFGGINKLGVGTMTLTGDNTYGGATNVTAGILNIRSNTGLGATAGGTTVSDNAALELQNNITVGLESLTLSGDGFNGSGGALRNVSGSNTWNGAITLAADARITTDASSTLTLNGTITSGTDKNVIFDSAGTTYATNAIGTGNGGVTKQSGGTLYLSGNSTYHGATTVSAGVVNISHDNALGATDGGTTVASGAALELQGNIHVGAESLSLDGSGISNGGALRNVSGDNEFNGTVTVSGSTALIMADAGSLKLGGVATGGNALTVGGAANTEITGALTGTSAGSITKVDASTLTISSTNNSSYQGNVNINSGTLLMAANNALNNAAVDVAVSGGTFSLQTYAQTIGSLSGTGTVDFGAGDGITTFSSLTLLADSTFSGTFTGTGQIIVGAGVTLTLGNDFNASGVTIVLAGGTLNVNGSDSTFAGLTLTANSTIDFDSSDDSIIHFTNLSLGSYSLAVSGWADEQDYFRVTNDPGNYGAAPLNQVSFANSGPWVGNDTIWTGDYSGYTYNDEVRPWKPVPEPSTYGAMLMGAGLVFFGYRRWRQQRAAAKR